MSFLVVVLVATVCVQLSSGQNCCADMPAIIADLQAQNDAQQVEIDALKAQMKNISFLPVGTGKCPLGFTYVPDDGGCYKLNTQVLNWDQSFKGCAASGANLVSITTQQQNQALVKFLNSIPAYGGCSTYIWIGMQRKEAYNCGTDMVWKKSDGSIIPMTYRNWFGNEPDCTGSSTCAIIGVTADLLGQWGDVPCGNGYCSICKA